MPRISRDTDIYPITMRELEVLGVEDVSPNMRRIVFGGEGLHAHERDGETVPAIVSDGFDDDMRMIFPHPETSERPYPVSLGDGRLDWTAEVNELFRTYTVRRWSPDAGDHGELVVDFARHGAGLAEGWSSTAGIGDKVYAAGPKNCASLPVHTDWLLLIGDETALPAIGRCLEEVPAGHRVLAIVEVPDRADIQDDLGQVACADTLDLRWVVRAEGGDFTAEVDALASGDTALPEGTPFVWAGGEAGRLKKVRSFIKTAGVPREHVQVTGYWRKVEAPQPATPEGDNGEAGEGAADAAEAPSSSMSVLLQLHELTEIAPGLALQAAARLALFEAIDVGTEAADGAAAPLAAVAEAIGVDPDRLLRFLRYLQSLDLLTLAGDAEGTETPTVQLTTLGNELADPEGVVARLTGPGAVQSLAWLHLDETLRTGTPAAIGSRGADWASVRAENPALGETLADGEATRAQWVAPALAKKLDALPGGAPTHVAVAGASEGVAAAVYADELVRARGDLNVTVLDLKESQENSHERVLREVAASRRDRVAVRGWAEGTGDAGNALGGPGAPSVLILLDPFALRSAQNVPTLLAEAASTVGPSGSVVIVTRLLAESGEEDHDYEEDLTRMLVDGHRLPTARDLASAVAEAGLTGVADLPVGWGSHAVVVAGK